MILATNNSIQLCQTPQPVSQAHNQRKRLFGFRVLLQPDVTDRIELANDNECCMEDKQFKLKKSSNISGNTDRQRKAIWLQIENSCFVFGDGNWRQA